MSSILIRAAMLVLLAASASKAKAPWPNPQSEEWADSPEAYFLTSEEVVEWKAIQNRGGREGFRERYWLKRDPTRGTERNEFRELVLARIKTADDRFRIEKTPGSRTARGFVFIVFGSPARVRDEHAPPPRGGRVGDPAGALEGNETITHWIYDRDRTPRILEAVDLPSLEVEIIIEPSRHSDAVQSPGLVKELREKLARKTIVNPDLIPGSSEPAPPAGAALLPRAPLDAAVRSILEKAPPVARFGDSVFGNAVVWRETGAAETLVWFSLRPAAPGSGRRFFHGLVRKENGGEEVASLSEPAAPSEAFSSADPVEVILWRLALAPGNYDAAFAVTEGIAPGSRTAASASAKLSVPDLGSGFAVSPLLLSRGPGTRGPDDGASPFAIGPAILPPRADATFSTSESLWFFVELANAADPSKVTLELRVRRGSEAVSSRPAFPAQPASIGAGRSLCGFEIPLTGLSAGDYRLYVLVRDGVAPPDQYTLRSADFRIRR